MAHDWPIAGMSNTGYPELDYEPLRVGPVVLKDKYEDGLPVVRVKVDEHLRRFTEKWDLNQTDMGAVMDFWELKSEDTSFTRLELDANSTVWATDTVTVVFAKKPKPKKYGPNRWKVTLVFDEIPT